MSTRTKTTRKAKPVQGHKQVLARVNVSVDEGMKELVEALNLFPRLETRSSCQGDFGLSEVHFWYGDTPEEAAGFFVWISTQDYGIPESTTWFTARWSFDRLIMDLVLPTAAVSEVSAKLRGLAAHSRKSR